MFFVENNSSGTSENISRVENISGGKSTVENNSGGTIKNYCSVENNSTGTLENQQRLLYGISYPDNGRLSNMGLVL